MGLSTLLCWRSKDDAGDKLDSRGILRVERVEFTTGTAN
jgi:hypothetical protein